MRFPVSTAHFGSRFAIYWAGRQWGCPRETRGHRSANPRGKLSMRSNPARNLFLSQMAIFALATAIAVPASAQDTVKTGTNGQDNSAPSASQQPSQTAK